MNKTCSHCGQSFKINSEDQVFYDQFGVPSPVDCPNCRLVRRLMERNPRNLYYRDCDFTKKKTLSQYHARQPFPVYSPTAWWSDDWDGSSYGLDFDFKRPFFEQFFELKKKVPHLALFNTEGTMQNSDYNNCTAYIKNCYLISESDYCEDCYYSNLLKHTTNLVDCSVCYDSQICYECIDCQNCYSLTYSQDCKNCSDSTFLKNCIACKDCIGCINQRQKQYMIFNQQYSKEDYEGFKKRFELDTREGVEKLLKQCEDFFITQAHKAVITEQNQSSSGDHLFNSKNAHQSFDSKDLEDCRYCDSISLHVKNSMDYSSWGNQAELMYQCSGTGDNCYNCKFCVQCQKNMSNCDYSYECFSCTNCFGCVGLKRKKYCILNKQYTKEEYESLVPRVIEHMKKTGEWGQFFPIEVCPFAYNESRAMDIFPLTKEETLKQGFHWLEEEEQTQISDGSKTPLCSCGKTFKIISQEAEFYKKNGIPSPNSCPNCRHKARMKKRNPLKLWLRNCSSCKAEIQSSYAPERKELILCDACYLTSVY